MCFLIPFVRLEYWGTIFVLLIVIEGFIWIGDNSSRAMHIDKTIKLLAESSHHH